MTEKEIFDYLSNNMDLVVNLWTGSGNTVQIQVKLLLRDPQTDKMEVVAKDTDHTRLENL